MISSELIAAALALIEKDKSKVLGTTVGAHKVEPGLYIPRADAQNPPQLQLPAGASPDATYLGIEVDLDAPFTVFSFMSPILHWMQPGLKADATGALKSSVPVVADYAPPGPPPGAAPHRYVFFLYEQPAGFEAKHAPKDGKKIALRARVRWTFDAWVKEAGLGEPVAVNYFTSN